MSKPRDHLLGPNRFLTARFKELSFRLPRGEGEFAQVFTFRAERPTRFRALVSNVVQPGISIRRLVCNGEEQLIGPAMDLVTLCAPGYRPGHRMGFHLPLRIDLPTLALGHELVVELYKEADPDAYTLHRGKMIDGVPLYVTTSKRAEEYELVLAGAELLEV